MPTIDESCSVMVGATAGVVGADGSEARYLRLSDVDEDSGTLGFPRSGPAPSRGLEAKIANGDVIVRARGRPAAGVARPELEGSYPSNDLLLLRPASDRVIPEYLVAWLNMPATRAALAGTTQGTSLPRLSVQAVGSLTLPLPPLAIQRRIAAFADMARMERELTQRLQELRSELAQELLRRAVEKAHDGGSHPPRELVRPIPHRAASPSQCARRLEDGQEQ